MHYGILTLPPPTVQLSLMNTEEDNYMADWGIEEIFLNFMLSKDVRPYCGVYISKVRTEEDWAGVILRGW